jgi:hypothetical protein
MQGSEIKVGDSVFLDSGSPPLEVLHIETEPTFCC